MDSKFDLSKVSCAQLSSQLVEAHSLAQPHFLLHLMVVLKVVCDALVRGSSFRCR